MLQGIYFINTSPNSLKDSNVNPKMNPIEEKKIGAHSLVCSTLGGKKGVLELRDGD